LFQTLGWYKQPVAALGTSNSIVAGILTNEALKWITGCRLYNQVSKLCLSDGVRLDNFGEDPDPDCEICG
jgi:hypothetical protein